MNDSDGFTKAASLGASIPLEGSAAAVRQGDDERAYPNGSPTYTTSTAVPGERPWAGTVHPSVADGFSDEGVKRVQHLIELNIDGVKGWETAADTVDEPVLKGRFREIAGQRRGFADELQGLVRRRGETPHATGTTAGAIHRWWLNLRAGIGAVNTRAVLEEAERGEDAIKHGYEEALKEGSLGGITRVIGDQSVQVRRVHDEIKMLRDQWRAR